MRVLFNKIVNLLYYDFHVCVEINIYLNNFFYCSYSKRERIIKVNNKKNHSYIVTILLYDM